MSAIQFVAQRVVPFGRQEHRPNVGGDKTIKKNETSSCLMLELELGQVNDTQYLNLKSIKIGDQKQTNIFCHAKSPTSKGGLLENVRGFLRVIAVVLEIIQVNLPE